MDRLHGKHHSQDDGGIYQPLPFPKKNGKPLFQKTHLGHDCGSNCKDLRELECAVVLFDKHPHRQDCEKQYQEHQSEYDPDDYRWRIGVQDNKEKLLNQIVTSIFVVQKQALEYQSQNVPCYVEFPLT